MWHWCPSLSCAVKEWMLYPDIVRRGCVSIYSNASVPDLAYIFKVVPEWNCNSSFAIQDNLLACNGVSDCENGKDEQNCTHSKAALLNIFFLSFVICLFLAWILDAAFKRLWGTVKPHLGYIILFNSSDTIRNKPLLISNSFFLMSSWTSIPAKYWQKNKVLQVHDGDLGI